MKKVMILLCFAFLFLQIVSSQASWKEYGGDLTLMWNQQYSSYKGAFNSTNVNISSVAISYYPTTNHVQPLVGDLGYNVSDAGYKQYFVIPSGSYLQVYDKNLNLFDEITTEGNVTGQIALVDFDMDGKKNEVIGVWNNTFLRVYSYNVTTNRYSLLNYTDLSLLNLSYVRGVRSSGYNTYFVASNTSDYLLKAYSTDGKDIIINNTMISGMSITTLQYTEPLSFYDVNSDGRLEYLFYDGNNVIVINDSGYKSFFEINVTIGASSNGILSAYFLQVDSTGQWRIVITYNSAPNEVKTKVYRQDGSVLWTTTVLSSGDAVNCKTSIVDDYDHDLLNNDNEIFLSCYTATSGVSYNHVYKILKGKDGSVIFSNVSSDGSGSHVGTLESQVADMDGDGYYDFISSESEGSLTNPSYPYTEIFSPHRNQVIYTYDYATDGTPMCVPADLTVDSKLDLICSQSSQTYLFYVGNIINSNAVINTVTYSPSASLTLGETLSLSISASDSESDTIYYSVKCSNSDSWSAETTSSSFSCSYSSVGTYNNTVRVRDIYHGTYNYLSYNILVTATGTSCNNNGLCETALGETSVSCPSDCITGSEIVSSNSSISIPTELVDVTDDTKGLLPEVWHFSLKTLSVLIFPVVVVVFIIFGLLILITIAGIFKKIINKA